MPRQFEGVQYAFPYSLAVEGCRTVSGGVPSSAGEHPERRWSRVQSRCSPRAAGALPQSKAARRRIMPPSLTTALGSGEYGRRALLRSEYLAALPV